jgi:hypothetical protein
MYWSMTLGAITSASLSKTPRNPTQFITTQSNFLQPLPMMRFGFHQTYLDRERLNLVYPTPPR